jgi:hypothetical protein
MLAQLAHPMSVPFSTRRSAQAALLLLSLVGGEAPDSAAVDAEPSHLQVHLAGYTLWATRCDRPLLLDDAAVLARAGRRDVLIMRLATSLHPASPLTFDWIPASATSTGRYGLLPALPFGGGLALVDPHDEQVRLDLTADAIFNRCDLPGTWPAQRELAMARANAVLNSQLWGGL